MANGHEGVVDQLLKAKADVNKGTTDFGATPLYVAAQNGHEGVVEQLLKAGADVNKARTDNGATPLFIAARNGHEGVVEQLLKARANVDHANGNEGPALRTAVTHGHREAALVLVEHGASDNTLTPSMMTTLYKWTAEALKEKNSVIAEKNRQMEEMVQGIPEWCAQAASSVAAEGQNDGSGSSSASAQPSQQAPIL